MIHIFLGVFGVLLQEPTEVTRYVEEISRKQVGSVIIIIEIVYWLVTIIYYVWRWIVDRNGGKKLVREKHEKKVWKSKIRRRVVNV